MYGPLIAQGIWRIITKQELRELYEDLDIVADFKGRNNVWIGRSRARMGQGRTVTEDFESTSEGRRRMGRPSLRWLEDVEKNLREMNMATEGSGWGRMGFCI